MKFINFFIFILLTISSKILWAQNFTPCFQTDIVKGCAPLKVKTTDCSGAPTSLIFYDYGDGRGPVPDKEVTYTKAGKFAITQFINSVGSGGVKTDGQYFVEVSNPIDAIFEVELCANFRASVKVTSTDYSEYFIDFGNGTSRVVKGGETASTTYGSTNPVTITVLGNTNTNMPICGRVQRTITPIERPQKGLLQQVQVQSNDQIKVDFALANDVTYRLLQTSLVNDETQKFDLANRANTFVSPDKIADFNFFRYRLVAVDKCNGEEFFAAETITAHQLNVTSSQKMNTLNWNVSNDFGFVSYLIYKNDQVLTEIKNKETASFVDINVKCGERYCYRIEAKANNGATKSISATKCVTISSDSDPKAIPVLVANVVNERLEIRWQIPVGSTPQTTILIRADDQGAVTQTTIPNAPPYVDASVSTSSKNYCYKIYYIDDCGNTSPESPTACSIRLTMSNEDDRVLLNWSAIAGASSVVIEKLDDLRNPYASLPTSGNTLTEPKAQLDRQVTRYRVAATIDGILVYSNVVLLRVDAILIFPNAFSPNNDGLNDIFSVKANFVRDYHLQIFSRWGILMYETADINAIWDGTYKGEAVPMGEYIFTIEGVDMIGKKISQKGILTVVK
jgi:gliding motility-associated-like protein